MHGYSCTQLGWIQRQERNNLKEALVLSEKACETMDAIGCYNQACYQCVSHNVDKTIESLKTAQNLGYKLTEKVLEDPDLACLKNNSEFKKLLQQSQNSKDKKYTRISEYHVFLPSYNLSIIPPMQFTWDGLETIVFTDSSGAYVEPMISVQNFEESLSQYKKQNQDVPGAVIKEREINGYKAFLGVRQTNQNGRIFKEIVYLTGDSTYTVGATASYPVDFEKMLGENIFRSLTSIIYKPPVPSSEKKLPFVLDANKFNFHYRGIFNSSALYVFDDNKKTLSFKPKVIVQLVNYSDKNVFKKEKPEELCKKNENFSKDKNLKSLAVTVNGFNGYLCEESKSDEMKGKPYLRSWILDVQGKMQRLVIHALDDEKQSYHDVIDDFVKTLKMKN